jgi:lipopolysaccharide biosynthesis glycosyltransferase
LEEIHIVTAVNDGFARHMGVMLFSLLENKKSDHPLVIHVLDGGLKNINKQKLKRLVIPYQAEIRFISVEESIFENCLIYGHVSKETYYRIQIPLLLDQKITKALYLDSDMIIHDDITRLWETDIESAYLAAIEDPSGHYRVEALSITDNSYFNAGVLLINLKKWRDHAISQQVIDFIRENPQKIHWWDQDGLNALLFDKWIKLDMKWNYQPFSRIPLENPSIVHFTSPIKPWNGDPPLKDYYFHYARKMKW